MYFADNFYYCLYCIPLKYPELIGDHLCGWVAMGLTSQMIKELNDEKDKELRALGHGANANEESGRHISRLTDRQHSSTARLLTAQARPFRDTIGHTGDREIPKPSQVPAEISKAANSDPWETEQRARFSWFGLPILPRR
jgi:hypothetical protein